MESNAPIGNFAVDNDDVYYTLTSKPGRPGDLTSDQATGALRKLYLINQTNTAIMSNMRLPSLSYLVTDASDIYLTIGTLQNHNAFGVLRVSKAGGETHQLAGGIKAPNGLAVDDKSIYWLDFADNIVQKVPKAGGDSVVLFTDETGNSSPAAIAVDTQFLFFLTQRGDIYQISKTGSQKKQIFRNPAPEFTIDASISIYANSLVWPLGKQVMLMNTMTGKARMVSAAQSAPRCVVADDKYVYWNDQQKGFMRVAK